MHMQETFGGAPIELLLSGGIRLGEETAEEAALVVGGRLLVWPPRSVEEVSPSSLAPVIGARAELLLLGTGELRQPLPESAKRALAEAGVAVESMSTKSAIRAYNALLDDPREVAAALLAHGSANLATLAPTGSAPGAADEGD